MLWKNMLLSILGIIIFLFSGCGENPSIKTGSGTVEICGKNTLTDTMVVSPGSTVTFKRITRGTFLFLTGEDGELDVGTGGELVAQGVSGNIISFNLDGQRGTLNFSDTASNNSKLEYCEFKGDIQVCVSNSMSIQYCKFDNGFHSFAGISILGNSIVQYNSLLNGPGISSEKGSPIIKYNNMDSGSQGISILSASLPDINNNNITNMSVYAFIFQGSSYTVTSNYVANCKGKTGADLDGSQSSGVVYVSPQTSPVSGTGCGW